MECVVSDKEMTAAVQRYGSNFSVSHFKIFDDNVTRVVAVNTVMCRSTKNAVPDNDVRTGLCRCSEVRWPSTCREWRAAELNVGVEPLLLLVQLALLEGEALEVDHYVITFNGYGCEEAKVVGFGSVMALSLLRGGHAVIPGVWRELYVFR